MLLFVLKRKEEGKYSDDDDGFAIQCSKYKKQFSSEMLDFVGDHGRLLKCGVPSVRLFAVINVKATLKLGCTCHFLFDMVYIRVMRSNLLIARSLDICG